MDDETLKLGYEVKRLSCLMRQDLDRQLSECIPGLTSMQARIIGYLHHAKEPVYQRDLEQIFQIRGSSVTSLLQLMEKNGWIVRSHVAHDARLKRLELTPQAMEINRRIQEGIGLHEERVRKGLTAEEIETFLAVIQKIEQNLV